MHIKVIVDHCRSKTNKQTKQDVELMKEEHFHHFSVLKSDVFKEKNSEKIFFFLF